MLNNIVIFRIGADWTAPTLPALELVLQRMKFIPCEPTQAETSGWVSPRPEDNSAMVESIGGQWIMKLAVERRAVPGGAVKAEVEKRAKALEAERGFKTGRAQKRELKEQVVLEFMPRAFSKKSALSLWLDPVNRFLVIGAGSRNAADRAIGALVETMEAVGTPINLYGLDTEVSPSKAMAEWLTTQEAPAGFSVDRELELKLPNLEKSVVKYSRHGLELEEIRQHIQVNGKVPTKLAMTWNSRVSFMLTEDLLVKKIQMLDGVLDDKDEGGFDADVAITTGELSKLIPDLIQILGGERARD